MKGKENFKCLPFVTEAWNLDESTFIKHTDNYILSRILNLVKIFGFKCWGMLGNLFICILGES